MISAVLLATIGFAGAAYAGSYEVSSCRAAVGGPLSAQAWQLETHDAANALTATDTCATGGSLELALAPESHNNASAAFRFDAPAGTSIVDYDLLRSLETAPAALPYLFRYEAFVREVATGGKSTDYGCASYGGDCVSAGNPADPLDPANAFGQHAPSLQSVQLWVDCTWEWCADVEGVAARARLFRSDVTLSDLETPVVLATNGSLLDAPATGTATLRVGASDVGGGVASATAAIDRGPAQSWSAGESFANCNVPYTAARPCPHETEASFAIDTRVFANGAHQLNGTVTDAAGNTTAFGPIAVTIGNTASTPPTSPPTVTGQSAANGSPAVQTPVITLNVASMVRARGTKTAATGRLTTQGGQPIAGAALSVNSVELATDSFKEQSLPNVITAADGSFSVPINHDGAQLLRVAFAPSPAAANTASASVAVRTRTAIRVKPTKSKLKRGRSVTLKGKLLGAGTAADGATVSIQAIVHGRWRPVGEANVRKNGSFKWRYRFVAVTNTTKFSFRAVVAKTPGWPWPTTSSGRTRVKVTA